MDENHRVSAFKTIMSLWKLGLIKLSDYAQMLSDEQYLLQGQGYARLPTSILSDLDQWMIKQGWASFLSPDIRNVVRKVPGAISSIFILWTHSVSLTENAHNVTLTPYFVYSWLNSLVCKKPGIIGDVPPEKLAEIDNIIFPDSLVTSSISGLLISACSLLDSARTREYCALAEMATISSFDEWYKTFEAKVGN